MALLRNNKGDGIAVIIYGISIMLLFIFTAVNILNAKVIETGYSALRDAVQSASAGSVIHLLTDYTGSDKKLQSTNVAYAEDYDIYLQLALGYIINRNTSANESSVKTGATNNFIKLDHKKVVNSTMQLIKDVVPRNSDITDTDRYKIFMIFIEPEYDQNYNKIYNLIVYGNGKIEDKDDSISGIVIPLKINPSEKDIDIYKKIQSTINNLINNKGISYVNIEEGKGVTNEQVKAFTGKYGDTNFSINLVPGNGQAQLIRNMETMPYYLIIVKDFALPTLFSGVETNTENNNIFRSAFTSLSGDGNLKSPMCALNSGKTERKIDDNRESWRK